ncbi:MAG: Uma2 family endonuclease [Tildeniella nuda ZEHNDER 1965/U140]|jgi:Uma2 family endonuclease|nr:Uma2 family endonuclease [Tildeniella nuda ZEHNDER 1965/U140]
MDAELVDARNLERLELKTEQRLILPGVDWQQYLALDSLLESFPGLRLTYLEGMLEIMTNSPEHELAKKTIARLLEIYAFAKTISLHGYGSTTYRKEALARGLEPDECYCLEQSKELPDLAIEVVITSGGLDKLAVYAGLGVSEVWFWQDQQLSVYRLRDRGYEPITRSELLPDLDLTLLASYARPLNQPEAVKAFYEAIR